MATAIDNTAFVEQLRQEQDTDPVINKTKQLITHGENIVSGRFKRVQNQLRIVNNILTNHTMLFLAGMLVFQSMCYLV